MKCSKCLVNEATIHILNQGDFCHTCHQIEMDKLAKDRERREIPKMVTVKDVHDVDHQFAITMKMTVHLAHWEADEIDGGYHFEILSKLPESKEQGFDRLIEKIRRGLSYKTLIPRPIEDDPYNALAVNDVFYNLKPIGTMEILMDDFCNPTLKIDGELIDFAEFGRTLTYYCDHNLQYQIRDPSDDVVGSGTVLALVDVNPRAVYERFEKTLSWFLEDNFLSRQRADHCQEALLERLEELRYLNRYKNFYTARRLAEKITVRLKAITLDQGVSLAPVLKKVAAQKQYYLESEELTSL